MKTAMLFSKAIGIFIALTPRKTVAAFKSSVPAEPSKLSQLDTGGLQQLAGRLSEHVSAYLSLQSILEMRSL